MEATLTTLYPYIFWGFCLAAITANLITVSRALNSKLNETTLLPTIILINGTNLLGFTILWFTCTLLRPMENHIPQCLQAWAAISLLPSLSLLRFAPKTTQQRMK